MFVASIIIMVAGLIGLIICAQKQKTNPAMQPLAFGCLVVLLIGLGCYIYSNNDGGADLESELCFVYSRGARAGKMLSEKFGGRKVLFLVQPGTEEKEETKKLIEVFKEAYGSGDVEVEVDAFPMPENPEAGMMMMEENLMAKDFNALLDKHADAGVIISDISLPRDAGKLKIFSLKDDKRPALVLLNQGMIRGKILAGLLNSGKVTGVVIFNPKANFDTKGTKNFQETFDVRYFLVTKDNLKDFAGQLQ